MRVTDLTDVGVPEDAAAEASIESFDTFEANALAKSRYFSALLPGRSILADDSGLVVDALNGEPGVRSKRWAGHVAPGGGDGRAVDEANNRQLLLRLAGVADRSARFVCAAAWCDGTRECVVRGEVFGRIVDTASGTHGFGYDPYFFVEELGRTLGEASPSEKDRVSHRGRAFVRLLAELRDGGVIRE